MKVDRYIDIDELDGTETEGQFADYLAAQESGDTSNWDFGVVEYQCRTENCPQFGKRIGLVTDSVKDYDGLIYMWHEKANEGDYFSRYMFEYIAFNAYVKSRIVLDTDKDRWIIQRIKKNSKLKNEYLLIVTKDKELKKTWNELIAELKRRPLLNSSKDIDNPEFGSWWNISEDEREKIKVQTKKNEKKQKGVVRSLKDWGNMVEFWYSIRNNLFHAGKDPSVLRDQFLVEHAFKTLNVFMEWQLKGIEDLKIF